MTLHWCARIWWGRLEPKKLQIRLISDMFDNIFGSDSVIVWREHLIFLRGLTHEPSHFWGFPSETLKYKKDWQGEKCQEPTSIFFPKRQVLGLFLGSWFSAFLASLLFCFFAFLLLCFPSFCAFLILCFCAFLLLLFYFFLYFSHVFRCSTSCSSASCLYYLFVFFLFFCFILSCLYPKCNTKDPRWNLKKP